MFKHGLTSKEVIIQREKFGANQIVDSQLESRFQELKKILLDPMGLMLLSLSGLYAVLGDTTDAIILLIAYIPVTAVDVILEMRAQRALSELKKSLKNTCKVIRDGKISEIISTDIVIGDIVVFEEGQSLPADGELIEVDQLTINEASLTGESIPLNKKNGELFFGGTVILSGRGLGKILAIGKQTKFGKIAQLLEETESIESPLQRKVNDLVRKVVYLAIALVAILFAIEIFRGRNFVESLIVAMTFGLATVPEEFPVVFTLYLSLGAWRLSKHGVLVKSLPSVEALGSVDIICTDKTGTLTEGKFQLEKVEVLVDGVSESEVWQSALMACEEKVVDSMEIAINEKGQTYLEMMNSWSLKWDFPFEAEGKHMSHIWQSSSGEQILSMKGAVEGVIAHCHLESLQKNKINAMVEKYAGEGRRLLGLARRKGSFSGDRSKDENELDFLGLLVFSDPIRSTAQAAIEKCQSAGIVVKMLTGDHPLTAHAVANEVGIFHSDEYLYTGNQLSEMTKENRWKAYKQGAIFSRVLPEQKFEMVQALKESGLVVAMTGDGINDAPALKLADIGISMGVNATDVARSSAQMILLKNNFNGIVEAIFEGRKIFSNIKRSFSYLISFHIPVIFLAFVPAIFGWGDLLLPIHIVLLELIVHPISAFAFENINLIELQNSKILLPRKRFFESALSGIVLSLISLWMFNSYKNEFDLDIARSMALLIILFGNIGFVLVESWPARTLRILFTVLGLIGLSFSTVWISSFAHLLHLSSISFGDIFIAAILGLISSIPTALVRFFNK